MASFANAPREVLVAKLAQAQQEIATLQTLLAQANAALQTSRAEYAVLRREMGWHDQRELGLAERIVELETRCMKCGKQIIEVK